MGDKKTRRWGKIGLVLLGLLAFAAVASFATVRMTEPSEFCARCHVMKPMYETVFHSAHREVTCNDCHTPQDNYLKKVVYKGVSGIWDAYVFFTGQSPQVFSTKPRSKDIIQANCIRCHEGIVASIETRGGKKCFECHRYTPHGLRSFISKY